MADELDPTAQGTSEAVIPPTDQQAQGAPATQQFEGIQKRIDELTAKFRGEQEANQHLLAQNQELMRTIAQIAEKNIAATYEAAPQVEVDPEDRRKVEAVFTPYMRKLESMVQQLSSQVASSQVASVAQGEDPRVVQRAQELMRGWRSAGKQGWEPQDAVIYARGEVATLDATKAAKARDERGRFAGQAPPLQGTGAPPPITQPQTGALPANFDSLDIDRQLDLLEKRLEGKTF